MLRLSEFGCFNSSKISTGNPLSGRLQRLRLKSCWLQLCTLNWRTEELLGFSAFWLNHVEVVRQTLGPANQLASIVSSWCFHESCKCHGFAKYLMPTGKRIVQVYWHLFSSTPCIWIRRKSGHARAFVFVIWEMESHHVTSCYIMLHIKLTSEWHPDGFFACTPFLTETCLGWVSGPLSLIHHIATFGQHVWRVVAQSFYPFLLQPVLCCMFFHDFLTWQALGYTASSLLVLALLFNVCND